MTPSVPVLQHPVVKGDVFDLAKSCGGVAVIGTNTATNSKGLAVMGRGAAKKASVLYPGLPDRFGEWLARFPVSTRDQRGAVHAQAIRNRQFAYHTHERYIILAFMVKYGWWEDADLDIIDQQARILQDCCLRHPDVTFFLTRVGSGNGRLPWLDVKAVLFNHLSAPNVRLVVPVSYV
jgi:hypothetical protein